MMNLIKTINKFYLDNTLLFKNFSVIDKNLYQELSLTNYIDLKSGQIRISSLANPGWIVKFNCDGTGYEQSRVREIDIEIDEPGVGLFEVPDDWFNLKKEDGYFVAMGGLNICVYA